jgi:hypothetical protein
VAEVVAPCFVVGVYMRQSARGAAADGGGQ